MENVKLKIMGALPPDILALYRDVLEVRGDDIAVFCDFSEYDIPIGHVFTNIDDMTGNNLFSGKIVLNKVSQEFILPYDMVPKGHKTVCKFIFDNHEIPKAIKELPAITNWYQSERYIVIH